MTPQPTIADQACAIATRVFEEHGCDGQSNKMLRALRAGLTRELPGVPVHSAASGWLPLDAMQRLRTFDEWFEDHGDVLWWRFPVREAPYVGSPLDLGFTVETHGHRGLIARGSVGGWPFDQDDEPFLRWTAIPVPEIYLKGEPA